MIQNLIEKKITMIKIFNFKFITFVSFINCDFEKKHEEQNKIMSNDEKIFFHHFIRLLLLHEILLNYEFVFNAIVNLKHAQNSIFIDFFKR